jgi:CelD/BcsL family acetyltransferase involved in cellulose biosynthesis
MTSNLTTAGSSTQPAAETAPTTVERISDPAGFEALREEWNELLRSSDSDCLFLTWEWLYTWWKHLAEDRRLSIFAIRRGGRLAALAPCCLRPSRLRHRRLLPVLEFLGSGCVGSDYLDIIVRRGLEAEARQALASALADQRLMLDWAQLRHGSCFAAVVAADLGGRNWKVSERVTNTCPYISLAGLSWEAYLATLGAEHRYNFNRKLRRLNRDHHVQFEQVRAANQCRESIDLVIELHNLRWRDRGKSDAFHTEGLVGFHREFSGLALERGWLRLYILRLNEKPVACLYGFLYGKTFYFYQSGFDVAYQKESVGLVTMGLGIQNAIEEGALQYDLLHGDEDYKSHWSRDRRELARLELYPPGGLGRISRSSVELERASRQIARRVLKRLLA